MASGFSQTPSPRLLAKRRDGRPERRFNSERSPSKSGDGACRARPLWSQLHSPPKEQGWGTAVGGQRPRTDLEGIVGRAARPPSAPVLQLHFRVQLLLVLLHDVREVRPPAALRVVIVSMATVWLGQEKRTWMGGPLQHTESHTPPPALPTLELRDVSVCLGENRSLWRGGNHRAHGELGWQREDQTRRSHSQVWIGAGRGPSWAPGRKEYTRENITFLGTGSLSNFVAGQRCK